MAASARRRSFGCHCYYSTAGNLLLLLYISLSLLLVQSFSFYSQRSFARRFALASATPEDTTATTVSSSSSSSSMLLVSLREHVVGTTTSGKDQKNKIRLILASTSPRRREILNMMGLQDRYDTIPSPLDESQLQSELLLSSQKQTDPIHYTRQLAEAKAHALAQQLLKEPQEQQRQPTIILGSDTIVELDGHILEKPCDQDDAKRMLLMLSGRQHKVHTGVALVSLQQQQQVPVTTSSFVDTAVVQFADLTHEDVVAYVATGEPLDKAGAYGIQGIGGQMVQSITGDFFTVMGLPMCRVSQELAVVVQKLLFLR